LANGCRVVGVKIEDSIMNNVTVECSSAKEFVDRLSGRAEPWRSGDWIFRGQANAEWGLLPTAAREDAFVRFGGPSGSLDWSEQHSAEIVLLKEFHTRLNRQGLYVPQEGLEELFPSRTRSGAEPRWSWFPLMALAQHHGLPTLFLDWTTRGWVAAYFACIELADGANDRSGELAIWAVDRHVFERRSKEAYFYEPPAATNPNLRAQSGLFTREIFSRENVFEKQLGQSPHSIRKVTLSQSLATEVIKELALEGISGSSLFPGVDGVVREMIEVVCPVRVGSV
jgi:FRG domain